jgi:mannose-1-phosphate guanylyltransferase/phosphomannomutase
VLGANVRLRERARVVRSVLDQSTFVGRSAIVEGAVVGRSCDIRAHAHVHDGVALGDHVVLGAQTVVMPNVRIFPHKEVESGTTVHESLVWEAAGATHVFGKEGVSGIVNVDLTPEARHGSRRRWVRRCSGRAVVASRECSPCRMVSGRWCRGNLDRRHVADLRVLPP